MPRSKDLLVSLSRSHVLFYEGHSQPASVYLLDVQAILFVFVIWPVFQKKMSDLGNQRTGSSSPVSGHRDEWMRNTKENSEVLPRKDRHDKKLSGQYRTNSGSLILSQ